MDLPSNIVVAKLPGPDRGKWPAHHFRDEVIWSPRRAYFALAYSICEASMCNEVGCLLLGKVDGSRGTIVFNSTRVRACCWRSPWCRWLDESTYVFKAQLYNGRTTCVPLVVVHAARGFQIVPGSNTAECWIDQVHDDGNAQWLPLDKKVLAQKVASTQ